MNIARTYGINRAIGATNAGNVKSIGAAGACKQCLIYPYDRG